MPGQPVMQLHSGAAGHAEVRHYDLISVVAGAPQLSHCDVAILGLVGLPAPATKVARQRRTDGALVVNDESPPFTFGSERCDWLRVWWGHCGWWEAEACESAGGAVGVSSSFFV